MEDQPREAYDLAIIGAGIIGCLAAYLASERFPRWRTLLIDRGELGSGATRHSAGLDLPYAHTPDRRRLCEESLAAFDRLRAADSGVSIYELDLAVVSRPERRAAFPSLFPRGDWREAEAATITRVRDFYPELQLGNERTLSIGGVCHRAPPEKLAVRLVTRLGERLEVRQKTAVVELREGSPASLLRLAEGPPVAARRVIVATGPWALEGPGASVARHRGVRIKKIVAFHLDRRPRAGQPVLFFLDDDAFLLPLPELGLTLFSFPSAEWDCRPDARLEITEEDRRIGLERLEKNCPGLGRAVIGGRVFCDAYGPDLAPVVAASESSPRVVFAGAGSGSGYRLAPAIARRALDAVAS